MCLENVYKVFAPHKSWETSLDKSVFEILVDYDSNGLNGILVIHKYLMIKPDIKMLELIKEVFITILVFERLLATKGVSLNNQSCLARIPLHDVKPN